MFLVFRPAGEVRGELQVRGEKRWQGGRGNCAIVENSNTLLVAVLCLEVYVFQVPRVSKFFWWSVVVSLSLVNPLNPAQPPQR